MGKSRISGGRTKRERQTVKKQTILRYLTLAGRMFIGAVFIYASVYKILDPADFAVSVRNYMIIPASWSNIVAMTLPWIEVGAGILLIMGIFTRPAALLTTVMLMVFLGAMIYAYSIGLDIDCGCFRSAASSSGKVGPYYFVRDSIVVIISLFVLLTDREDFSILRLLPPGKASRGLNG